MGEFDPFRYDKWEEFYVSTDRGKREVHFYLKRRNGSGSDLVVVGKEKTLRHFSYRRVFQGNSVSLPKLRSRREVIDWLNSFDNSEIKASKPRKPGGTLSETINCAVEGSNAVKKLDQSTKHLWVGSPWTCRKRRTHYPSYRRSGVNISAHDFVYVLGEGGERLVAHLNDMYEDLNGSKMVVVQWFHKMDEVGIDLPQHNYEREILFSLCLQDISIECIDGLATVLSPEHYEIYLNGATRTQMEPFVCHRLFDKDEVKTFDVTRVKGYWKQDLVRWFNSPKHAGQEVDKHATDAAEKRPPKKLRWSKECDKAPQHDNKIVAAGSTLQKCGGNSVSSKSKGQMGSGGVSGEISPSISNKIAAEHKNQHLDVGSKVEVLSEDSGINGCWFRAEIVKKHKEKMKVRYEDIMDAIDEDKNLEEWILAFKVAASDKLGIRFGGRPTVRPAPKSYNGKVVFNLGTIVDVFQHDGWWEGIVIEKQHEDRFRVYLPGEKRESVFRCTEMRLSQEWFNNGWNQLKERPDLVSKITGCETKLAAINLGAKTKAGGDKTGLIETQKKDKENKTTCEPPAVAPVVRDLSKDDVLLKLKWKTVGRRSRSPVNKLRSVVHGSKRGEQTSYERFFTMKADADNCNSIGVGSSVVTNLTGLVMTR